ncbi:transmembrane protein 236 [Periophthalmus magnuspinnatus]|uniref:transmembrane protein 236 n=1 Tax=Periophthalmus magnuspinnatus TaxID=409849 RepID=UPI00145B52EF|nr:transmembrane protein 236 [Periophthalmus magnuspinnatus]
MPSGKTVKLIVYEILEFTAFVAPVFVVLERFAGLLRDISNQDWTTYWLIVSVSVAYVTSVTLLAWVPLEYMVLKRRRFIVEISQWRPTVLTYLVLSTAPCFGILIASSKVQVDADLRLDQFTELPVSLVLFSMIFVDIVEQLRPHRLLAPADDFDTDMTSPVLTHLDTVTTISAQMISDPVQTEDTPNGVTHPEPEVRNGVPPGRWQDGTPTRPTYTPRTTNTAYLYSTRPRAYSGPMKILWRRDPRAELFVESFMFWLDTVEMVRIGGIPDVFYSAWVFPVYIFSFVSTLRLAITPNNPLHSWAGVVLQDFPFFVLRVALLVVFGYVTPVLFLMKNLIVCLTYVYFTFLTKLKLFRRQSMF